MGIAINDLLTVTLTLFAVIDIIGSVPAIIGLRQKVGDIHAVRSTLIAGVIMIGFLFAGNTFLRLLGLDVGSFAIAGSIVIFLLGLEMVLGLEFFKSETEIRAVSIVPIAFPLIAGSGTLTTIISLEALYPQATILIGILINLVIVFVALTSLRFIERILGAAGVIAIRKFFGVILLAIAVKIFAANVQNLIH
jgi:multiple antibiotic resistance protein